MRLTFTVYEQPLSIEMIDAIEIALWDAAAAQSNLPVESTRSQLR